MRSKQFLPLLNGDTLYRLTYDRAALLVGPQRILVVTTAPMLRHVRRLTPELPPGQIIVEGEGRNTAPSAGLAAEWIRRRHGDGYMVILPSDHQISTAKTFRADVSRACRAAQRAGRPVLVGTLTVEQSQEVSRLLAGHGVTVPDAHSFLPIRSGELYRRALAAGHRNIKVMNLMALGPYEEPQGTYAPSVMF